ncbi:MAG: S1 family peptidase [Micromonosporaceae bacterium]
MVITAAAVVASVAFAVSPAAAAPSVTPQQAYQTLNRQLHITGTAWAIDHAAGKVVVTYDRTVTGEEKAQLNAVARRLGDTVRLESIKGRLDTHISGGQSIYGSGGARCTLGFNVASGATDYFLTAGHCTNVASTWYGDSGMTSCLGTRSGTSFPSNDYGIVRYTCPVTRPGDVFLYNGTFRDITSAGNPQVGQTVCMSGPVGGLRCGSVISLNTTVNYPQGTVSGLIRTNLCSYPGESGAPLFAGNVAVGLLSGGSGSPPSCTSYFQPVTEVLAAYGVSVK